MRAWIFLALLFPSVVVAQTTVGVVRDAATGQVRRVIVPDNDKDLPQQVAQDETISLVPRDRYNTVGLADLPGIIEASKSAPRMIAITPERAANMVAHFSRENLTALLATLPPEDAAVLKAELAK